MTVTVPSQASLTVGGLNVGAVGQLIGVVCVAQVSVGEVLSCTTIVALHVAELPQVSVAIQVRVTL